MVISNEQKELIAAVCQKYEVKILLLFGSEVDGRTHKESDVDVAFLGKKLSFEELAQFNTELQKVFGREKIDTVSLLPLNPLILKRIFDNHQVLYLKDRFLYHTLSSYATKSYLETKFLRENLKKRLEEKYVRNR
ncbi:MAG: nucleotidyltransferase domain-containing protein [bacterium]|nr:nucleotidyltransferase domain-containing protein [bacterium]